MHKADTLIADEKRRKIENKVRVALRTSGYPEWALKEEELRRKRKLRKEEVKHKGLDQVEDRKSK